MSRRVATMTLTGVLLVVLIATAWIVPVPYVTMSPGPTEDVLGAVGKKPVIEVAGKTFETNGRFDLTTVSATPAGQKLELLNALEAWLDPTVAVVPTSFLYPDDKTPEQVDRDNAQYMEDSQLEAMTVAFQLAGESVSPAVLKIIEGAPAMGRLKAGDLIEKVDGRAVSGIDQVGEFVNKRKPGETVTFTVRRDYRRTVDVTVKTRRNKEGKAVVGIEVAEAPDRKVTIHLGQEIGGPSAGLMFALGIYDKLEPGSLTAGKHIAGTGTIDRTGRVGAIGGIQQKIVGAREAGATVFLVPADNCDTAAGAADGIQLVKVSTLKDAVESLKKLGSKGGAGKVPTCEK